ncbi:MAG TPA: hypothetical protein VLE44_01205 [Candidatus Saccharimonadales bacterium]|nr:hypothetical protein [Candidatus Saccharimonadales bacterium]
MSQESEKRKFNNGKKFSIGERFNNPSGREFCNGHDYITPAARGLKVAVRENGTHQREKGNLKSKFEIIFDVNYLRRINKGKRTELFMSAHELAERADKK